MVFIREMCSVCGGDIHVRGVVPTCIVCGTPPQPVAEQKALPMLSGDLVMAALFPQPEQPVDQSQAVGAVAQQAEPQAVPSGKRKKTVKAA